MDYLSMLSKSDIIAINNAYKYNSDFMLDKLFRQSKTENLIATAQKMINGSNVPIMAQVHAFNAEARIGDRPSFEQLKLEKLFIKEKINTSEKMLYWKNEKGVSENALKDFIMDDVLNMATRVMTRTSVMNGELLSNGNITVKENNVNLTVDYGFPTANAIALTGWGDPTANILGDIEAVKTAARAKGYKIVRAITSSKVMGYIKANNTIQGYFTSRNIYLSDTVLNKWLKDNTGIEFVVNDDVYGTAIDDDGTIENKRIYKEDNITWLTTDGIVGEGLFGVTPEELGLVETSTKGYVAITQYKVEDPVAIWTKASTVYLPVIKDINGLFISTVAAEKPAG